MSRQPSRVSHASVWECRSRAVLTHTGSSAHARAPRASTYLDEIPTLFGMRAVTLRVTPPHPQPTGDVTCACDPGSRQSSTQPSLRSSRQLASFSPRCHPLTPCSWRGQGSRAFSLLDDHRSFVTAAAAAASDPAVTLEPCTSTVLSGQMPLHVKTMTAEKQLKPPDHRRSNKPIMEKRRRARINNCLGELKGLILEAMKKDPARHSKLEKADILEMTVKHLQSLQRQQMAIAVATDPTVMTKFRSGFNECATEVARYVNRIDGVDRAVRQRLIAHLRSCITGLSHLNPAAFACLMPGLNPGGATAPPFVSPFQPMHVQVPSASAALNVFSQVPFNVAPEMNSGAPSRLVGGLNLIPSRLPNGDLAFVLPNQQQNPSSSSAISRPDPAVAAQRLGSSTDMAPSAAPLLQPAFPTNPTATVTSASGDRRTPSAFTPLAGAPSLQPVSPSYGCNVTSTTSPNSLTFSPASRSFDEVAATSHPVKTEDDVDERFRAVCSLAPLATAAVSLKASPDSAASSKETKTESRSANQMEAYDLSKPSTSQVCSMSENDKMWRPW